MPDSNHVIIVGAGLGGSLIATALAQEGYRVDLYERRSDPRSGPVAAGRSINLAISVRGLHALKQIGLDQEIHRVAVPMPGRMIHSPTGALTFQPYGVHPDDAINSVSRLGLNIALLNAAARHPNLRLFFDHRCTGCDLETATAEFQTADGRTVHATGDFILSADGAFSAVRGSMQRLDRFDYRQDYLKHGYKELCVPPDAQGGHRMEKNALHIWPRKSYMMIALPNIDGSYTCTLFFPFEGPESFAALRTDDDVRRFFQRDFPDAVPLMPTLIEDWHHNPASSLVTVRCGPWHYKDKVVLLGDAAHAVVPFYGQGANAAFEDCVVFLECLKASPDNRAAAFADYYQRRKRHADALANLAIGNFIEMRDKTASTLFHLRKKYEKTMHKLLPAWYLPLYSMVSFSRTPYADAVERARRQDHAVIAVACILLFALAALIAVLLGQSG